MRREVLCQHKRGRSVRLMFQDEGRLGLLDKPRRYCVPAGVRPVVGARLLRKFSYAFAAVSPPRWRNEQPDSTVGERAHHVHILVHRLITSPR